MASVRATVAAALVVLVALLTGCGGGADSAPVPAGGQVANGPLPAHRPAAALPGTAAALRTDPRPRSRAEVPVLMYHVIASPPAGAAYPGLWVSGDLFRRQLGALVAAGFHGVTLEAVHNAWTGHGRLPDHPVVVSFDDGYLSQGTTAATALADVRWPGVLNLALHALDAPGGLTSTRVRRMVAAGWEIDAHSLTHPDLTKLDPAALAREVAGSRSQLRHRFGVAAEGFCYPAGKFDATTEAAVRKAGYVFATTELPGAARPDQDPMALHRIRVNGGDAPETVVAAVRAASGTATPA